MKYLALFLVAALMSVGTVVAMPAGTSLADDVDTSLRGTNDRFVIASLGIDAPVNTRNVNSQGYMGDPAGKDDVVRYDFPTIPGVGGYPGQGGTTVIAGHVDYHPNFTAVFWTLRQAAVGTRVDYYRADGVVISYLVDWIAKVGGEDDFGQYLVSENPEAIVMVSCEGTFNPATLHYDNRTLVHATRVS